MRPVGNQVRSFGFVHDGSTDTMFRFFTALVDGGFPAHEQIDAVHGKTTVYAPVPEFKARKDDKGEKVPPQDKHERKPGDSEAVAQWRKRMAGEHAKEIYKQRAATAECVNAAC